MKKLLFLVCLGFAAIITRANSFTIADPMSWNSSKTGTFDTVRTFVSIHGAFVRYDVQLVISGKDHPSNDTTKLEAVCSMTLPKDASVVDASCSSRANG